MPGILKPVANETFCNTTASAFGNNRVVRMYNSNTSTAFLITRQANSTVNLSTITIGLGQELILEKFETDLLISNSAAGNIFAVPVAYKEE